MLSLQRKNELSINFTYAKKKSYAESDDEGRIESQGIGDASGKGVAAAVYTVVVQEKSVNRGLVASRARLVEERIDYTSDRVGVWPHGSEPLVTLGGFPVSVKYCWLDSTVALHWIRCPGEHKQFLSNRGQKIQAHSDVVWHHMRTSDNPAGIGSRSGEVTNHALWWNRPEWLSNKAS